MSSEENSHLERELARLSQHVTDQDAEIFRQSRQIDQLTHRLNRMEGRLKDTLEADESQRTPAEEKPPHY